MNNIRETILKEAKNYLTNLEGVLSSSLCFKIATPLKKDFILLYSINKNQFKRGFIITTNGIYIKKLNQKYFISFDNFKKSKIFKKNYNIYLGDKKLFVANKDLDTILSFFKELQYNFIDYKKVLLDIQNRQQKIEEELKFVKMLAENVEKLYSTLNSN